MRKPFIGPILFLLYTTDIHETANATIAIFTDDTAILSSLVVSNNLQLHLTNLGDWIKKNRESALTIINRL